VDAPPVRQSSRGGRQSLNSSTNGNGSIGAGGCAGGPNPYHHAGSSNLSDRQAAAVAAAAAAAGDNSGLYLSGGHGYAGYASRAYNTPWS